MKKLIGILIAVASVCNETYAAESRTFRLFIQPGYHNGTSTTSDWYHVTVQAQSPNQAIQIAYGMCGGKDSGCEVTYEREER